MEAGRSRHRLTRFVRRVPVVPVEALGGRSRVANSKSDSQSSFKRFITLDTSFPDHLAIRALQRTEDLRTDPTCRFAVEACDLGQTAVSGICEAGVGRSAALGLPNAPRLTTYLPAADRRKTRLRRQQLVAPESLARSPCSSSPGAGWWIVRAERRRCGVRGRLLGNLQGLGCVSETVTQPYLK
jgi:hypothetical protein